MLPRMFWRLLKPNPGLADQASVWKQPPTTRLLIALLAIALASGVAATPLNSAAASSSGDNSATTEMAPAEFPADTSLSAQAWVIASEVRPGYTIRHTVPEIRLQFSVADEQGRLVTDLSARDIRIFDDHSAVRRIRQFSRADDLPLQVGLLLDVSDSVQKSY